MQDFGADKKEKGKSNAMKNAWGRYPARAYGYLACTLCVMGLIFFFSSQNISQSSNLSGGLSQAILSFLASVFPHLGLDEATALSLDSFSLHVFIRKAAHLFEYAVLGLFSALTLREFGVRKHCLLAWIFATLYAATDEWHQFLGATRSGRVFDVGVDSIGVLFGVLVVFLFYRWVRKRKVAKKASEKETEK